MLLRSTSSLPFASWSLTGNPDAAPASLAGPLTLPLPPPPDRSPWRVCFVLLAEILARRTAAIGAVIPSRVQRNDPLESRLSSAHRPPSAPRFQEDSPPCPTPSGSPAPPQRDYRNG